MSEQTTDSQFVAPQEMGVLEAEQATQTVQAVGMASEGELILPLVASEQDMNNALETPKTVAGEQLAGVSWISGHTRRIAAALTLVGVLGAGAACAEAPSRQVSAPAGTSVPAQPTATMPAVSAVPPTVESIDPSALQASVGVAECRFADGPTGLASNDAHVASIATGTSLLPGILRQDVASLLQSSVEDIHSCATPIIVTAINDGRIITSEEFKQQSTGILVEAWVSLDTQDSNECSAEANAIVRDIVGGKASGMRLSANNPDKPTQLFKGAVAAYTDPDNPGLVNHEEGVISYKDNTQGVLYDLRVAIDNGQRATANIADQVSLPALDHKLITWLSKTFVDLKYMTIQ